MSKNLKVSELVKEILEECCGQNNDQSKGPEAGVHVQGTARRPVWLDES